MKNLFIFILLVNSFLGKSQVDNTFFVTKKNEPNNVKYVFQEGDKLKITYSSNSKKIKGQLTQINDHSITIDSSTINLSEIETINVHDRKTKIFGGILFSSGTGLIALGIKRSQNPIEIEKQSSSFISFGNGPTTSSNSVKTKDGKVLIGVGTIICGISSIGIISPRNFNKYSHRFATNVVN